MPKILWLVSITLPEAAAACGLSAAEVGGVGDRYVCVIHGQETNLWMEKGRWFVEAKLVAEA